MNASGRLILAITGASGAIYGVRRRQALADVMPKGHPARSFFD